MNIEQIVADLKAERARIDKALEALEALSGTKSTTTNTLTTEKRGGMSEATKAKLRLAAKKRWAKLKGKKTA